MTTSAGSEAAWQAYLAEDYTWFPYRCGIFAIVLATIAYPLRFWSRSLQSAPWGWSDWLMIPSYIFVVGIGVCGILCATYGSGRHIEYVIMQAPWYYEYWGVLNIYITPIFYIPGVTFPKLSVFCIYLRIMENRFLRFCCWLMMGMLVARLVVEFITIPLQCSQLWYAWEPSMWPGNCDNIWAHYTWGRIPNVVSDVAMLILPMPTVWNLKLEPRAKFGLFATFCLGGFGLVASILNMVGFIEHDAFDDITWASGTLIAWSVLETSVYFNTACLITYRPLLAQFVQSTISRANSRASRRDGAQSRLEKSAYYSTDSSDNDKTKSLSVSSDGEPPHPALFVPRPASRTIPRQSMHKTLPPSPVRVSLTPADEIVERVDRLLSKPRPSHRVHRDRCGSCYDCVAMGISQHMERAHTMDIV